MLAVLNDKQTYQQLSQNPDRSILNKIKLIANDNDYNLTNSERDYLTKFEIKTSQFYGLPKIHKSQEILA